MDGKYGIAWVEQHALIEIITEDAKGKCVIKTSEGQDSNPVEKTFCGPIDSTRNRAFAWLNSHISQLADKVAGGEISWFTLFDPQSTLEFDGQILKGKITEDPNNYVFQISKEFFEEESWFRLAVGQILKIAASYSSSSLRPDYVKDGILPSPANRSQLAAYLLAEELKIVEPIQISTRSLLPKSLWMSYFVPGAEGKYPEIIAVNPQGDWDIETIELFYQVAIRYLPVSKAIIILDQNQIPAFQKIRDKLNSPCELIAYQAIEQNALERNSLAIQPVLLFMTSLLKNRLADSESIATDIGNS